MNRRSFLRLLGIGAATAVVSPEMVLDPERALWVPGAKRIFDLGAKPALEPVLTAPFRIVLPDGTVWNFDGIVKSIASQAPIDDLITTTLEIQPTGPMTFEDTERQSKVVRNGLRLTSQVPAHASFLGGAVAELRDIELPRIETEMLKIPPSHGDEFETFVPGLRRCSPVSMTIHGTFEPETLTALLDHRPGEPITDPRRKR